MRGLPNNLSLFPMTLKNQYTRAQMLDFIYHMTLKSH